MTHAAQVAFTLLADIADEDHIRLRMELCALQRRGNRQHRHHARRVIADSGAVELVVIFAGVKLGSGRKNRVQVGADSDPRRGVAGMQKSKDVPQIVDLHVFQAEGGKSLAQPFATCSFAERRRGYFRQLTLPAPELHLLVMQVAEGRVHTAQRSDAGNFVLRRRWRGSVCRWGTDGHDSNEYYNPHHRWEE